MQRHKERSQRLALCVLGGTLLCAGCQWVGPWRETAAEGEPGEANPNIDPAEIQAILRGRRPGILVAANGGMTSLEALPNSLAAIRAAIEWGVPMVVLDVCQTADGAFVLDLDHQADKSDPPWTQLTLEEIRAKTADHPNGPAPTLAEALEATGARVLTGLRLRAVRVADVVQVVEDLNMTTHVLLVATTRDHVAQCRKVLQEKSPVLVCVRAPTPDALARIEARPPWPDVVQLDVQTLSPANIARVQSMGARTMVHQRGVLLVRVGSNLEPYHRMGVTILLTDWPRQLLPEMQRINRRTPTVE